MITEEQRLARKSTLGGSDVAALYHASPWMTEYELWLDKTGRLDRVVEPNSAIHWGNRLEGAILDEVEARHPDWILRRDVSLPASEYCAGNLDGLATHDGKAIVVEAKTARSGDAWQDGVPEYYKYQVLHYCSIAQANHGLVAVLISGADYREFELHFSDMELHEHREKCQEWWQTHVVDDVAPIKEPVDVIKHSVADGSTCTLDHIEQDLALLRDLKDQIKALTESCKHLEDRVKVAMASATEATLHGAKIATWKEQTRESVDAKKLAELYPDVFASCCKTSTYRVLRLY